jgi:FkbM family methyltransferase
MSDVKQVMGLWLPAHETHLDGWIKQRMREHPEERVEGVATYQFHKLNAALRLVRHFRTAVDVGAHCGLWSMHLARRFMRVHAWEPIELHRKCFGLNVSEGDVTLHAAALGAQVGKIEMHTTVGSSGDSWINPNVKDGSIPLERLDDYGLTDVDFIKLDTEGHELLALQGAEETIRRCRPAICVEQKPGRAEKFGLDQKAAIPWLESLGAVLRKEMSGDFLMSFPEVETQGPA